MAAKKRHGIEDLTRFAMEVIKRSGEEALSYYGKGNPNIKFDEELVTEADSHLMEFFQNQLNNHFPEHQIFRNNPINDRDYTHDEKRYIWIFDPLDGVANFQAGIPIWGISLALIENFWPIFGVFYMPATGDLFHARAGEKAFLGDEEIHVSEKKNINDESLLFTYSRFHHRYRSIFPGKSVILDALARTYAMLPWGVLMRRLLPMSPTRILLRPVLFLNRQGGRFVKWMEAIFSSTKIWMGKKSMTDFW